MHKWTLAQKMLLVLLPVLVGFAGLFPHIEYSLDKKTLAFFKSGSDEDTYAERALTQRPRSDRLISSYAYKFIYKFSGQSHKVTFIIFDFLFPALITLLALLLSFQITQSPISQVAFVLSLLFAQEMFSTGSSVVWPQSMSLWNLLSPQNAFPDGLKYFLPYSNTSYFVLFRTPDPQISWCIFIVYFIIWNKKIAEKKWGFNDSLSLIFLYLALLPFTYIFVILPLYVHTLLLIGYFSVKKDWNRSIWSVGLLICSFLAKALYDSFGENGHLGFIFESHLPTVMMSSIYSLILLIYFIKKIDAKLMNDRTFFYLILLTLPLLLSNQQMITGRMVSPSSYEIYANYLLMVISFAILIQYNSVSLWLRRQRQKIIVIYICLLSVFILRGLGKTYSDWYFHNDISYEYLEILKKNNTLSDLIVIKDSPETAPLMEAHQNQRLPFAIHFNNAQDQLVSDMKDAQTAPAGREWHQETVFRYVYRLGMTEEDFARRLQDEVSQKRGMFLLPFLFSIKDCWFPLSEHRAVKTDWMLLQIEQLKIAYGDFLKNKKSVERAFVLSQEPLPTSFPGFQNILIDQKKIYYGTIYLYKQVALN